MRDDVRLLTLTGPGGVGKTRLAIEAARGVAETYLDGVIFVGLAPITDPGLVASAIAQPLGVRDVGDAPLERRLAAFLRDRSVLLVLDNFEHLVEAAPLVANLLSACAGLTALVTSRVRLRVSGEHEYPVSPLALADPGQPAVVDRVAESAQKHELNEEQGISPIARNAHRRLGRKHLGGSEDRGTQARLARLDTPAHPLGERREVAAATSRRAPRARLAARARRCARPGSGSSGPRATRARGRGCTRVARSGCNASSGRTTSSLLASRGRTGAIPASPRAAATQHPQQDRLGLVAQVVAGRDLGRRPGARRASVRSASDARRPPGAGGGGAGRLERPWRRRRAPARRRGPRRPRRCPATRGRGARG